MFLDEWQDDKFSKNLTTIIALSVLALSIFLSATTAIDKSIFYYLGISALIILVAVQLEGNFLKIETFGNKTKLYAGLAAGGILGIILGMAQRGGQLNAVLPTQALYFGQSLNFLFANIIAPIVEPLFWRGIVFLTLVSILLSILGNKNKALAVVIALAISGYGFGFFHLSAFYQQAGSLAPTFEAITFAALFGIIFTITNSLAKTLGLEIGWHFVNNLFAQGYPTGDIFMSIAAFTIISVVVIEILDRRS